MSWPVAGEDGLSGGRRRGWLLWLLRPVVLLLLLALVVMWAVAGVYAAILFWRRRDELGLDAPTGVSDSCHFRFVVASISNAR